jgi:hypothetical protein
VAVRVGFGLGFAVGFGFGVALGSGRLFGAVSPRSELSSEESLDQSSLDQSVASVSSVLSSDEVVGVGPEGR